MSNFDWDGFLNLAKELWRDRKGEAELRTSISRSYYSVFHKSQSFCDMFKIPIPPHIIRKDGTKEKSRHQLLIMALRQHHNYNISRAGRLLDSLRDRRTQADYESQSLDKTIEREAEMAIREADEVNIKLLSYIP